MNLLFRLQIPPGCRGQLADLTKVNHRINIRQTELFHRMNFGRFFGNFILIGRLYIFTLHKNLRKFWNLDVVWDWLVRDNLVPYLHPVQYGTAVNVAVHDSRESLQIAGEQRRQELETSKTLWGLGKKKLLKGNFFFLILGKTTKLKKYIQLNLKTYINKNIQN